MNEVLNMGIFKRYKITDLKYIQVKWTFLAWSIIVFLLTFQFVLTEIIKPSILTLSEIIWIPISRLFIGYVLIIWLIIPIYNRLRNSSLIIKVAGFIFGGILFCSLFSILTIAVQIGLKNNWGMSAFIQELIPYFLRNLYHLVTYYFLFITILLTIDYLNARVDEIRKRKEVETRLSETRFIMLRKQLQPHFLFNALNSVVSIMDYQKELAQSMLTDISELLRNSLYIDYSDEISVAKELKILSAYLRIEKMRFAHQLIIEEHIEDGVKDRFILPFTIQPLVENAIKHGYGPGIDQLTIQIEMKLINNRLHIKVRNNGVQLSNHNVGLGLTNLKERLSNYYGDRFKFKLGQEHNWVTNYIIL